MGGRIPQSFIDDLLSRIDIVDVIEERLQLRKQGSNYQGLCPFHNEKTPSFSVSQQKQFYYCFGCGASGSAITFLMEYDRLEFPEAIRELAERCGLTVPDTGGSPFAGDNEESRANRAILQSAAAFFSSQLREHPQADKAVGYLKERGLSGEIAARFGLGYAPPGWTNLSATLGDNSAGRAALLTTGLCIARDDGSLYDRFRDRIIYPIRNHRGQVIGFGGRSIGNEEPKYLNSPETPLFHKGRELYGLYESRQARSKASRMLVVEGYMDVVALHQFGVYETVATLGTATSAEHLKRLYRIVPEIVFCFDGDAAGQRAAWRALEIALPKLSEGRSAGFLFLPPGEDPDSLIRAHGPDYFRDLERITSLSDFLFEELRRNIDPSSLDGKARLADRASPLIEKVPGRALQQLLKQRLRELTGLDPGTLDEMVSSPGRQARKPRRSSSAPQQPSLIRSAVALLLAEPPLAGGVEEPRRLLDLKLPGCELLVELLEICQQRPHLSCAGVLEHFRGHASELHLKKLAAKESAIPAEGRAAEFSGVIEGLWRLRGRRRREALARKENRSPEETEELRTLTK
jgi:DNA primase